ncbi:MAG: aldehyde dehydrogenase (NADP(+)) [Thermoanaerobaculia bacterium]|nr:aldehyde dehydrogenase (NADP(+)) [Thermoanaerobaculia bacterium]
MTLQNIQVDGRHFLGADRSRESQGDGFRAVAPASGDPLDPTFADATAAEVDRAVAQAVDAFPTFEAAGREARAKLLETIADHLEDLGDSLLDRAAAETALPKAPRLQGERGRTTGQLKLFADVLRKGSYLGARIDHADPDRTPIPKPDVRRMLVPLGPVAIFGASNFPLAFSVAGGDTASALAAGCPVVAKGHPGHPGTSELVAAAIADALRVTGLPAGAFSLVQGAGYEVGQALVQHPGIRAVGFTGSLRGGRALFDAASRRPVPIPVYAEMGSTNPMFLLPGALSGNADSVAEGLAGSVCLGVGQFCTNPGLVFVIEGEDADALVAAAAERLAASPAGTMLHEGIRNAYEQGVDRLAGIDGVELAARGEDGGGGTCAARPALLTASSQAFLDHAELHEEVFGPATLVVRCPDGAGLLACAKALQGQLTTGVHGTDDDLASHAELLQVLQQKAGRVLFGGYPTGVEVNHAMQHGGPYPATTDTRSTSVGTAAIDRFLRPVAWQNAPQNVLPEELRDGNPAGIPRLVDGVLETA